MQGNETQESAWEGWWRKKGRKKGDRIELLQSLGASTVRSFPFEGLLHQHGFAAAYDADFQPAVLIAFLTQGVDRWRGLALG